MSNIVKPKTEQWINGKCYKAGQELPESVSDNKYELPVPEKKKTPKKKEGK